MKPDLRQLRYFVALAEELNFARAATRLHMTQPPLSQQIMQLEASIGAPLFLRGRRPLRLTTVGRDLLDDARRLLAHADTVLEDARNSAQGGRGILVVAFVMGALPFVLPTLLLAYRTQFPGVRVDLRELVSPLQCDALLSGEIDVGVMRPIETGQGINSLPLVSEDMLVALPIDHRLVGRKAIAADDICREPFVAFSKERAGYFDEIANRFFAQSTAPPTVVQVANQLYTVISLVASGMGVALVPASARQMAVPRVAYVPIASSAKLQARLVLGWSSAASSPVLANFTAVASELFAPREQARIERGRHPPLNRK